MSEQTPLDRVKNWSQNSITLKAITIGILILVMLIPLSSIESLIRERKYRNSDVREEIQSKWGRSQNIQGIILTIPYKKYTVSKDKDGVETTTEYKTYAHFLPEEINLDAHIQTETRYRSIYDILLFSSSVDLNGFFNDVNLSDLGIKPEDVLWDEAFINLGIKELASIHEEVKINVNGKEHLFQTGIKKNPNLSSGLHCNIPLNPDKPALRFDMHLQFNASENLAFSPLAKTTNVTAKGEWPHVSFDGAFIPIEKNISDLGFEASWKILHINRPIPASFTDEQNNINQFDFQVGLIEAVDQYQSNTRAVKYGALVISLVFISFLFVQMIYKVRIHPVQYLLVGFSICIFFVLLLAFSEHLNFQYSYVFSALATIIINSLYFKSIFNQKKTTIFYTLFQFIIYGFIFILVNLEEYSLIVGALGLFIIISMLMFGTKNFKWYAAPQTT